MWVERFAHYQVVTIRQLRNQNTTEATISLKLYTGSITNPDYPD